MRIRFLLFFITNVLFASDAISQLQITRNGKPVSRIVVNLEDSIDLSAAHLMQDFIRRISGAELRIIDVGQGVRKNDILIGNFQQNRASVIQQGVSNNKFFPFHPEVKLQDLKEDGFQIITDEYIRIYRGEGKGSIYAVVTLLEQYLNVQYYAQHTVSIIPDRNIVLPAGINRIEDPSFRYRQTQTYHLSDPLYKLWHRLEEPSEVFAGNLWVHTFDQLLPSAEFGEKHPEYYSFINGQRRPGAASQWCLTNESVFEIDLGVSILNERDNTIEEYCLLYPQRNFPGAKKSLAAGKPVHYILPPSPTYQPIADKALTDELYGGATYNEGWVGWEGKDGEFVIDLGEEMIVETVEADFLHKLGAWIFLPRSVSCSVSTDNLNYKFVEKITIEENREGSVKYVRIPLKMKEPGKVRYIKLYIESVGLCPPWHYGVGYPGWFFLDEVNVY